MSGAGFAAVVAGVLLAGRVVCKEIFGGILTWGFLLVLVLLLLYALIRQRSTTDFLKEENVTGRLLRFVLRSAVIAVGAMVASYVFLRQQSCAGWCAYRVGTRISSRMRC